MIPPNYDPTCGDLPDVEILRLRASWIDVDGDRDEDTA